MVFESLGPNGVGSCGGPSDFIVNQNPNLWIFWFKTFDLEFGIDNYECTIYDNLWQFTVGTYQNLMKEDYKHLKWKYNVWRVLILNKSFVQSSKSVKQIFLVSLQFTEFTHFA